MEEIILICFEWLWKKLYYINSAVADGKFNQALLHRALDQKNKGVFESPTPLNGRFKVANRFDIQNPVLGNLLSQINTII